MVIHGRWHEANETEVASRADGEPTHSVAHSLTYLVFFVDSSILGALELYKRYSLGVYMQLDFNCKKISNYLREVTNAYVSQYVTIHTGTWVQNATLAKTIAKN